MFGFVSMPASKPDSQSGSALILALVIVILLSIVAIGYVQVSVSTYNNENQSMIDCKAFKAAESGMRLGKAWLDSNYSYTTNLAQGAVISNVIPNLAINNLGVQVDIIKQATGVTIRGTAKSIGVLGYNKVVSQNASANNQAFPFAYAAFGKTSITFSGGGITDSYNSGIGPYGGTNIGSAGNIGTNGTQSGIINLSGGSIINGNAGTGVGGTVSISGGANVTGAITNNTAVNFASVSVPSSLTSLASSGNYSKSGGALATITAGNYNYTGFSVSGGSIVTISGNVNLYVSGGLTISGGSQLIISPGSSLTLFINGITNASGGTILNQTTVPSNFMIESTYSGANGVQLSGGSALYGAVYAPNADVTFSGGGNFYGAVVGNKINDSGGTSIHYDTALLNAGVNVAGTASGIVAGTWTVQNTVN